MTFEGIVDFNPDWVVSGFRLLYKSDPVLPNADFHIHIRAPINIDGLKPLMPITANLIENRGRGRVTLVSTNPRDLPVIEDAMLTHPGDIAAMAAAMVVYCPLPSFFTILNFGTAKENQLWYPST